jgi:hypothetical protein
MKLCPISLVAKLLELVSEMLHRFVHRRG